MTSSIIVYCNIALYSQFPGKIYLNIVLHQIFSETVGEVLIQLHDHDVDCDVVLHF